MKIIRSEDCGNSPKNALLAEIEIALASKDLAYLNAHIEPSLTWSMPGCGQGIGLESLFEALDARSGSQRLTELEITSAFSHGKMGAVYGLRKYSDGEIYEFCNLYELKSAGSSSIKDLKIFLAKILLLE